MKRVSTDGVLMTAVIAQAVWRPRSHSAVLQSLVESKTPSSSLALSSLHLILAHGDAMIQCYIFQAGHEGHLRLSTAWQL